jgi:hypothetical protein
VRTASYVIIVTATAESFDNLPLAEDLAQGIYDALGKEWFSINSGDEYAVDEIIGVGAFG